MWNLIGIKELLFRMDFHENSLWENPGDISGVSTKMDVIRFTGRPQVTNHLKEQNVTMVIVTERTERGLLNRYQIKAKDIGLLFDRVIQVYRESSNREKVDLESCKAVLKICLTKNLLNLNLARKVSRILFRQEY
ncbi:MAG: hypothetical protein S4CHLAM20_02500 [Chlamydiia bacterium]|nr:hypothetical protein [Chlamydiia bacterium]